MEHLLYDTFKKDFWQNWRAFAKDSPKETRKRGRQYFNCHLLATKKLHHSCLHFGNTNWRETQGKKLDFVCLFDLQLLTELICGS